MDVALTPTYSAAIKDETSKWLLALLGRANLDGVSKPVSLTGHVYINNAPKLYLAGRWQLDDSFIHLAGTTSDQNISSFSRLAILAAIAKSTGVMEGPLVERFSVRLAEEIRKQTQQVYGLIVSATQTPQRMAIDPVGCQVATEINGRWTLQSGATVEVGESWIIMNF